MLFPRRWSICASSLLFLSFFCSVSQQKCNGSRVGGDRSSSSKKRSGNRHNNNEEDRVASVPGYSGDELCWSHYAGYLDGIDDHRLFYWYHEAVSSPGEKPLVLWLNGGPGCSSLGGMFTELGPFVVNDRSAKNVTLNPFSFNKVANMLFIEQPVGVGFSAPGGIPASDESTAVDTVAALRSFLRTKHPELRGRPFYVMGESYGGHYVPNTVKEIQETNARILSSENEEDADIIINIVGFAVGNGYTDWKLDFDANVENGRYHALTSASKFRKAKDACDGDYARCFWPRPGIHCPEECDEAVEAATIDARDGTIDIYDIYNDVCLEEEEQQQQQLLAVETQITTLERHRRQSKVAFRLSQQQQQNNNEKEGHPRSSSSLLLSSSSSRELRATISPVYPTCIDIISARYLNRLEVQKAIHAVPPGATEKKDWFDCSPTLDYDFNFESELPNYRKWVGDGSNLEILIYNGDADYILSHVGNSAWINEGLNLTIAKEWTKWHGSDGQVAGYFETYETNGVPLAFLTVKGAGHMVPRDRPRHALDFFARFLAGGSRYDAVPRSPPSPVVTPLCSA